MQSSARSQTDPDLAGLVALPLREQDAVQSEVDRFLEQVHSTVDRQQVAYHIVNAGRRVLQCDRLSLVACRNRASSVLAVSGVDHVDQHSSTIVALRRFTLAIAGSAQVLCHPSPPPTAGPVDCIPFPTGPQPDLNDRESPSELDRAINKFVEQAQCRELVAVPLFLPTNKLDRDESRSPERYPLAMLVAENFEQSARSLARERRWRAIQQHAAMALVNANRLSDIPLRGVWEAVAKARSLLLPGRLGKSIAALVTVAAIAAGLCLVPAELKIAAEGTLQPQIQRHIFAPSDGIVQTLTARHGDTVAAGDALLQLGNTELAKEITRLHGELQVLNRQLEASESKKSPDRLSPGDTLFFSDPSQLAADHARLTEQQASLKKLQGLLSQQNEELTITSPISGEVLTWNIEDRLTGRAVRQGDRLVTVAQTDGPWVIELLVDDRRIGHLLRAERSCDDFLPVSFVLAADASTTYRGNVAAIATTTESVAGARASVRVRVKVPGDSLEQPRPGASVNARISCGRRSVGYVWFHELIDAITGWVMFW